MGDPAPLPVSHAPTLSVRGLCKEYVRGTPVFRGLAWDLTGIAQSAFVPLGACAVLLMALAPGLRLPRAPH